MHAIFFDVCIFPGCHLHLSSIAPLPCPSFSVFGVHLTGYLLLEVFPADSGSCAFHFAKWIGKLCPGGGGGDWELEELGGNEEGTEGGGGVEIGVGSGS